ncbi:hypothetical protein ACFXPW_19305 [Streptomyces goshikiensis]|uniref:hypothetical protein n=1 Tax=Streptomyces goshikiensis TaxID=1942 RepID=UPI0036CEFC7C
MVAVTGAALLPLLYLSVIGKAQMEVGVVERAADLLFAGARLWFLAGFLASAAGAVRVPTRGGDLGTGTRGISRGVTGPTGALRR